jgi:hypothetical protein
VHDPVGSEEGQNTLSVADLKCCEILIHQFHCDTLLGDAVLVVTVIVKVSNMTTSHAQADDEAGKGAVLPPSYPLAGGVSGANLLTFESPDETPHPRHASPFKG